MQMYYLVNLTNGIRKLNYALGMQYALRNVLGPHYFKESMMHALLEMEVLVPYATLTNVQF